MAWQIEALIGCSEDRDTRQNVIEWRWGVSRGRHHWKNEENKNWSTPQIEPLGIKIGVK
jgi:hypothetical protein